MTEAPWGDDGRTPQIDWQMSASIEDVPRGDSDIAEVTSLERAVRAWLTLDPQHRSAATLTLERAVQMYGVSTTSFTGEGIAALAKRLPAPRSIEV